MQAIDLVRSSLGLGDYLFQALLKDLRDHPLATQSPAGGNHAIWTLGHITLLEAALPTVLSGGTNPLAKWEPLFSAGTKPSLDAAAYPSFDELLAAYREHRAILMKQLDDVGEAGMDRVPAQIPTGFEPLMATFGQTFQLMAMHQMLHAGELADVRRSLGLKPLS